MSFVQPCVQVGFPTSVVCTEGKKERPMSTLLREKTPLWSMIESMLLLDAMNPVLP